VSVPEKDLPVLLPSISDYKPEGTGKGPLANHKEFFEVKCPKCGGKARRETDVMDTFVDSSWYFLRYPSVDVVDASMIAFNEKITKKWLPVNLYFGGAEHSVLHLMYARFVTMVLHDLGYLSFDEPFPKFFAHGLMIKDGAKMSKSRGNVVNPDEYVKKYGADALRLYLAFMGPMDASPDFRDSGMEGASRFLGRVWRLFTGSELTNGTSVDDEVVSKLHQTIKKVTEDVEKYKYNTAISALMGLVNIMIEHKVTDVQCLKKLALLLAPFAPHMMEEVWVTYLQMPFSIHAAPWPLYEVKHIVQDEVTVVVQINGKVRSQLVVDSNKSTVKEEIEKLARENENIAKYLEGVKIKNIIFVSGKLLNFVTQ
jgi:leucyl-tRNA synthetase